MAVFKVGKCRCGYKKNVSGKEKETEICPSCGETLSISESWYISYTVNGKKYVKSVGSSKRMAEDALAKVRVDVREGRFFDRVKDTAWEKAVVSFRQWIVNNCKPKTVLMYENSLRVLTPYFGKYTLNKITPQMVEAFKAERSAQVTNSSVNRDLATLKRLFSLAEEWGMIEINKIRKVKKLKENPARTRSLTENEANKLIEACGPEWLKLAVLIAVETGLRKSAIFTLRRSDIDFTKNTIEKKTKGDKKVRIPMTQRLRSALQAHLANQKVTSKEGYLFPSPANPSRPLRIDSDTSFKNACKKAGIKDFRFHDLRHTFATRFYQRTKDWKALQEILGHSDVSVTMRVYTHLQDEHLKEAMKKFEGAGP